MGSAVLEAPEQNYALRDDAVSAWQGRGPAPAGALQRGFGADADEQGGYGAAASGPALDEPEYVPRRGSFGNRFRGLERSMGGRILMGVVAFGALAGVGVVFAAARYYALHNPRFVMTTSDDIEVVGAKNVTRDQVLSVFGADLERNIFRVALPERKQDLERLPWVEHATVMRLLPDKIRVQITERTPVAFVRQGTQIGLVDASGVLLDMTPEAAGDPQYSFPVLTGLSADDAPEVRARRMEVYSRFMTDLDRGTASGGGKVTDSLSEVDVSNPEDVKAVIPSNGTDILVHFGEEDFLKRYQEYQSHLAEWKQQYPRLASADMRYEGQIVLEMQKDGDAAVAGSSAAGSSAAVKAPVVSAPAVKTVAAASAKPVAKAAASKPAVVKGPAVAKAPAVKLASAPAGVGGVPTAVPVNLGSARPVAGGAAKPAVVKGPAAPKAVVAKKAVAVKKPAPKAGPRGKAKPGSGVSAANERVFAQLAAAHKAAMAKAAKSGGVTP
jgi:cell division protein FtsQ